MFSGQFYEKSVSVRERNRKLPLETVIITVEIVMCIMHCRKYYLYDCGREFTYTNSIKIVTHISCLNF